jgi:hypothetical protein
MKVAFGLIIDTKVIKSRSTILVIFGLNSIITQMIICLVPNLHATLVIAIMAQNTLGTAVMDATIDSIKTE